MYETVAQSFAQEGLARHFDAAAAKDQRAVFQFNVVDAGSYTIIVNDGTFEVKEGVDPASDVVLAMRETDYLDLVNNRVGIQQAFMTGRLEVGGDLSAALKLATFFPAPKGGY